jgi:cytoskeletal protein RodZ
MDNYTDQKPKTGAGSDFDQAKRKSEVNVSKSTLGSNSTLTYIVVALVLIFGALLLFTNNWGTTTPIPTATQDSTTPPAPDAMAPVAPAPATPPAAESTTPPATGTAPQPPVAPAQ